MSLNDFDQISNAANTLASRIGQLQRAVADNFPGAASEAAFRRIESSSGHELVDLLDGLTKAADALANLSPGDFMLPPGLVREVRQGLGSCSAMMDQLIDIFSSQIRNNGGGSEIRPADRSVIAKNGSTLTFHGTIDNLLNQYDALLRTLPALFGLSNSRRRRNSTSINIAALTQELETSLSEAKQSTAATDAAKDGAEQSASSAIEFAQAASERADEVARMAARVSEATIQVEEGRKSFDLMLLEIEQLKSDTEQARDAAAKHAKELQDMHSGAPEREKRLAIAEEDLGRLVDIHRNHLDQIEATITRANEMISGATVTGLATSFGKERDALGDELAKARSAVHKAIFATVILAFPLWAPAAAPVYELLRDVILWAGGLRDWQWALAATASLAKSTAPQAAAPPLATNGYALSAYLAARTALVVPGLVLLWFAIRRHNALFQLREHYAYKYSMAMSVTGFKKEAPEYEQEIAAMTLAEVAFNPGDGLSPPRKPPFRQRRFLSKLLDKVQDSAAKKVVDKAADSKTE